MGIKECGDLDKVGGGSREKRDKLKERDGEGETSRGLFLGLFVVILFLGWRPTVGSDGQSRFVLI